MVDPLALRLLEFHPRSAAQTLRLFSADAFVPLLEALKVRDVIRVVQFLPSHLLATVLMQLNDARARQVLEKLPMRYAAPALACLTEADRELLLTRQGAMYAAALRNALRYPPGTAGAVMRADVLTLSPDMTIAQAQALVRQSGNQVLSPIFVLDSARRIRGQIDLDALLAMDDTATIGSALHACEHRVGVRAALQSVLDDPAACDQSLLPVVDSEGFFVGVLPCTELTRALNMMRHRSSETDLALTNAAATLGEMLWEAGNLVLHGAARLGDRLER